MECVGIAGLFLILTLLALYGRHLEKRRVLEMKQMAAELKLRFSEQANSTAYLSELPPFYLFSRGSDRRIRNLMHGMIDDSVTMTLFDYGYEESTGEGTTTVQQTVLLFQSSVLALPFFTIRAKSFFHWLTGRAGFETAKFPRHRDRLFSNIYFVERRVGQDVQAIFTARLLSYCEHHRLISIEGENGCLLFYQPEKVVDPHALPSFIEQGKEVLALFPMA